MQVKPLSYLIFCLAIKSMIHISVAHCMSAFEQKAGEPVSSDSTVVPADTPPSLSGGSGLTLLSSSNSGVKSPPKSNSLTLKEIPFSLKGGRAIIQECLGVNRASPSHAQAVEFFEKSLKSLDEVVKTGRQSIDKIDIQVQFKGLREWCKDRPEITSKIDRLAKSAADQARRNRIKYLGVLVERASKYRRVNRELGEIAQLADQIVPLPEHPLTAKEIILYQKRGMEAAEQRRKSCSKIDLRSVLGEARSQGRKGWCYAFASADILSYKLGQRVSAIAVADSHIQSSWFYRNFLNSGPYSGDDANGGWESSALRAAISQGVCLERDAPSEGFQSDKDLVKLLEEVEAFRRSTSIPPSFAPRAPTDRYASFDGDTEDPFCVRVNSSMESLVGRLFPTLTMDNLIQALIESDGDDIVSKMINRACKRVTFPKAKVVSKWGSVDVINDQLSQKNVVSIGYSVNVLENRDAPKWPVNHSSTVVGREFDEESGSCNYWIRNQWGTSCEYYDPRLHCEQGHVLVPEDLLDYIALTATYLE